MRRRSSFGIAWSVALVVVIPVVVGVASSSCSALIGADFDRSAAGSDAASIDALDGRSDDATTGSIAPDDGSILGNDDGPVVVGDDAASDGDGAMSSGSDGGGICTPNALQLDPANCGRCGHDCLGGACLGGVCQPVVLATGMNEPAGIAVSDGYVYWTVQGTAANAGADGKVSRAPITGCGDAGLSDASTCPEDLATAQQNAAAIAVNTGAIFWTKLGTAAGAVGSVMRLGFDGKPATTFVGSQSSPRAIAIDDPNVIVDPSAFWVDEGNGTVRAKDLAAQTSSVAIVTGLTAPVALAVTSELVCVADSVGGNGENDGTITCTDRNGKNGTTLATDQGNPAGITIGSTYVFWTNQDDGTIRHALPSGAADAGILLSSRNTPTGIVVSGAQLFWTESGTSPNFSDGTVQMANADGTQVVQLAKSQKNPRALALDGSALYWVDRGTKIQDMFDGAIMKVALP